MLPLYSKLFNVILGTGVVLESLLVIQQLSRVLYAFLCVQNNFGFSISTSPEDQK